MATSGYKTCIKCGETKAVEEFYGNCRAKDGYQSCCKICNRLATQVWREGNPERVKAQAKQWVEDNRKRSRTIKDRWKQRHPQKVRAHKAVSAALLAGELTRPNVCESCGGEGQPFENGSASIQAHHSDYSKPLEVEWLCHICHTELHLSKQGANTGA